MVTKRIDIEETPTTLEQVLEMVESDTEVIVLRGEVIIARILPWENEKSAVTSRVPGLHAETIWTSDDFDEPLPDSFWLGEE